MASVGNSGFPISEVGREGFPGEIARVAKASMSRGLLLFRVLFVRGIRAQGVLLSPTRSSHSAQAC